VTVSRFRSSDHLRDGAGRGRAGPRRRLAADW